jgi:hypothetical protein
MIKVSIDSLTPVEYNPRTITDQNLDRLAGLIRDHTASLAGWNLADGYRLAASVTVNRQGLRIVSGSQRVTALMRLGQGWIAASDITWVDLEPGGPGEKALNLAMNAPDAQGKFGWDVLAEMVKDFDGRDPSGELLERCGLAEATWKPLLGSNPEISDTALYMLYPTEQQRVTIDRAIEMARLTLGPDTTDGKCVVMIAGQYLELD